MQTSTTALKLSRLPKSDGLRSLNFKRTTPGTFGRLLFPGLAFGPPVDKSHPLARTNPANYVSLLPSYNSELFKISVFPKALLTRPEIQFPDKPPFIRSNQPTHTQKGGEDCEDTIEQAEHSVKQRQRDVSVLFHLSKKGVHSSSVVRKHIKTRVKSALSLVVTKGHMGLAQTKSSSSSSAVGVSSLQQLNYDDWTIVIQPTLRAYRAPMEDLISNIRAALEVAAPRVASLDSIWSDRSVTRKEILSQMRNRILSENVPPMRPTSGLETPQNLPRPQRYIHEEIEELLLEDDEERREKPPEPTTEQKRARLLEKDVQDALFASRPIIRPLLLHTGRAQKGREPKHPRRTRTTEGVWKHQY